MDAEYYIRSRIAEGQDIGTAALLRGASGTPLVKADVSEWQVHVYDLTEADEARRGRPVYALENVNPASENTNAALPGTPLVISDTVLLDGFWPYAAPSTGRNFLHFIRALGNNVRTGDGWLAYIRPWNPKGSRIYRCEYLFQTTWGQIPVVHDVEFTSLGITGLA